MVNWRNGRCRDMVMIRDCRKQKEGVKTEQSLGYVCVSKRRELSSFFTLSFERDHTRNVEVSLQCIVLIFQLKTRNHKRSYVTRSQRFFFFLFLWGYLSITYTHVGCVVRIFVYLLSDYQFWAFLYSPFFDVADLVSYHYSALGRKWWFS